MKPFSALEIVMVAIPEQQFRSWPPDRSFQLLSEDMRALRRRAVKGVGVEIQRGLFVQVARRLDALALEYASGKQFPLKGLEAEAWLELNEILKSAGLLSLCRPTALSAVTVPPPRRRSLTLWSWISKLIGQKRGTSRSITAPGAPARPLLGEQVLFPGAEVESWQAALSLLDAERLCAAGSIWRRLAAASAAALLQRSAEFFAQAGAERCAVVQVLHDAVST